MITVIIISVVAALAFMFLLSCIGSMYSTNNALNKSMEYYKKEIADRDNKIAFYFRENQQMRVDSNKYLGMVEAATRQSEELLKENERLKASLAYYTKRGNAKPLTLKDKKTK